jgi:hypothetical protein
MPDLVEEVACLRKTKLNGLSRVNLIHHRTISFIYPKLPVRARSSRTVSAIRAVGNQPIMLIHHCADYRLAMIYHPDASHPSSSTDNFMALRNAYNLLKNEGTRTTYNRTGVGWSSNPSHSSSGESPSQWQDDMMREQIRRRANSYGNAYGRGRAHGYGRGEGAYSQARWGQHAHDSDYGFAGYAHAGPDRGSQTGNYMSNVRFVGSLAIVVS